MKKNIDVGKFVVLHDNVLIKAIHIEERDGIIKPAQYDDKAELGTVINVGQGNMLDNGTIVPLTVKKNDIVYFNKYSSTKFNFDSEEFYVVREEDIVFIQ